MNIHFGREFTRTYNIAQRKRNMTKNLRLMSYSMDFHNLKLNKTSSETSTVVSEGTPQPKLTIFLHITREDYRVRSQEYNFFVFKTSTWLQTTSGIVLFGGTSSTCTILKRNYRFILNILISSLQRQPSHVRPEISTITQIVVLHDSRLIKPLPF